MPGKPNIDRMAPRQHDKISANYRHHESCRTCASYNGRIACSKVEGNISPDAVCVLWGMIEDVSRMTGKEVITKAYDESKQGELETFLF